MEKEALSRNLPTESIFISDAAIVFSNKRVSVCRSTADFLLSALCQSLLISPGFPTRSVDTKICILYLVHQLPRQYMKRAVFLD